MAGSSTPNTDFYNGPSGANTKNIVGATAATPAGFHGVGSVQAANIADVTGAAGANPTQAEYATVVAALNAVIAALEGKGITATA